MRYLREELSNPRNLSFVETCTGPTPFDPRFRILQRPSKVRIPSQDFVNRWVGQSDGDIAVNCVVS
jgi:hypothetical protein